MLSIFPSLFTYSLLSGLILRLTLGLVFLFWGYKRLMSKSEKIGTEKKKITAFGTVKAIIGILLIIGLWTQLAALASAIILIVKLAHKARSKSLFTDGVNYYFILLMISLALLFTGAGALAFDLPL